MAFRSDLRLRTISVLEAVAIVKPGRVHDSRKAGLERDELPALSVFTPSSRGQGTDPNMTEPQLTVTTSLAIEVNVDGADEATVALRADQLCERVEAALLTNADWVMKLQGIVSVNTDINIDSKSDRHSADAVVTFEVVAQASYEPVIPDDFRGVDIDVDFIAPAADPNLQSPGPDGRIEVRAKIDLPAP